jgi:predicted SAM-dependent methyltransferase
MKVHVGSGSVYLVGYLNVDVHARNTFLACNRPDLVERYITDERTYYSRHQDRDNLIAFKNPLEQEYVCDKYGDFTNIPVATASATEVLARQSFEHLSYTEAKKAFDMFDNILAPDGILRIDVPDHDETLRLLRETGDDFFARHLYGTQRNAHGYHVMSYSRSALIGLAAAAGFILQFEEPNIHPYPAFCLRFIKSELEAPRAYAKPPYEIPDSWYVADIGPGSYPHPRANVYIDIDAQNLARIKTDHTKNQMTLVDELEKGLPALLNTPELVARFGEKLFDYVFCSHVLEHVEDPQACVNTLMRIAKRGTIVLPSAIKESLFNFEEPTHKWMILPHPQSGIPIFIRRSGFVVNPNIIDPWVQQAMCRMYRTGPNYHEEVQHLRKWYKKNEPLLDVIVHWEDTINIMVIQ